MWVFDKNINHKISIIRTLIIIHNSCYYISLPGGLFDKVFESNVHVLKSTNIDIDNIYVDLFNMFYSRIKRDYSDTKI